MNDFVDREGGEWMLHDGATPALSASDMIDSYERGQGEKNDPCSYGGMKRLFEHNGTCTGWDIVIYRVIV